MRPHGAVNLVSSHQIAEISSEETRFIGPQTDTLGPSARWNLPKPLGLKSSTELHALGELVAVDAGGSLALHPAPYAGTLVEVLRAPAR